MDYLDSLTSKYPVLDPCMDDIFDAYEIIRQSYVSNGMTLVCADNDSVSAAEDFVIKLMKGLNKQRSIDVLSSDFSKRMQGSMPAINLCAQQALIKAISDDIGEDLIFAQQVFGYGNAADTLIAISASGSSDAVIKAALVAKDIGMPVVAITGKNPSMLSGIADVTIRIPTTVGELFLDMLSHVCEAICAELENCFFGE